jgi:hypothetical protein
VGNGSAMPMIVMQSPPPRDAGAPSALPDPPDPDAVRIDRSANITYHNDNKQNDFFCRRRNFFQLL